MSEGMGNRGLGRWGIATAISVGVATAGCDSLLDVSLPGETSADALASPAYSGLLVTSAQGDFECAFSNFVYGTGHLAGELVGGNLALQTPYRTRDLKSFHQGFAELGCNSGNPVGIYTPLSTARFMADDALDRISAFTSADVPERDRLLGRAALYAGFSYTLFAETFCSATFNIGPELDPRQVLDLAEDRFSKALEYAGRANDAATVNAAYVGRARVRLPLGRAADAAADARMVPPGFRMDATRSNEDTRRRNAIYVKNTLDNTNSIDEKYWDVTWMDVPDPRVRLIDPDRPRLGDPLFYQTKYTSESSPIRLASYTEARLIIAEVEGGQTAVQIINELHEAAGIPGFTSDVPDEIRSHIIEERRREFFLEGRRFGDLRRFGGLAEAASHGERNPHSGAIYGHTECFPIPDVERRGNPNIPLP